MQTRMQELPKPAVAGGLALLGGVAMWQLGVEFERAWLRSCDGPLLGETPWGDEIDSSHEPASAAGERAAERRRRRWVAGDQRRLAPRVRLS